jgi:hypothetical protein
VYVRLASLSSPRLHGVASTANPCPAPLAIMTELIREPSRVAAAGEPPKLTDEHVGRPAWARPG